MLAAVRAAAARQPMTLRALSTAAAAVPSTAVPASSTAAVIQAPASVKFKNHFKRASSIMADIDKDARGRQQVYLSKFRAPLPDFNVGDAIQITYANEHAEASPVPVRGTVMAKRQRGLDSKFTIINAVDDEWYTATYTYASPLLRSVKIMMRNRHSEGVKRARRAKLTYLYGRDPKTFLVDQHTKEWSEIQKEKEERREMQRQGKVYKKAQAAPAKGGKGAAGGKGDGKKPAAAAGGAKKK